MLCLKLPKSFSNTPRAINIIRLHQFPVISTAHYHKAQWTLIASWALVETNSFLCLQELSFTYVVKYDGFQWSLYNICWSTMYLRSLLEAIGIQWKTLDLDRTFKTKKNWKSDQTYAWSLCYSKSWQHGVHWNTMYLWGLLEAIGVQWKMLDLDRSFKTKKNWKPDQNYAWSLPSRYSKSCSTLVTTSLSNKFPSILFPSE